MNAGYNSSVRETPDAKSVFDFLNGMNFNGHLKNRSSRAKTPKKLYSNSTRLLASGLEFLP